MYRHISGAEGGLPEVNQSLGVERPEEQVTRLREAFSLTRGAYDSKRLDEFDDLELKKNQILEELLKDLEALDKNPKSIKLYPGAHKVSYSEIAAAYSVGNGSVFASEAELMTDGEWGVLYTLDSTVDIDVRRKYLLEVARLKMRKIRDQQITAQKVPSNFEDVNTGIQKAYSAREQEPDEYRPGILAEKMVRTLLKKTFMNLSRDNTHADAGYSIEEVDIQKDVERKIDFVVHVPLYKRGVKVEGVRDIGVQFTTIMEGERLEKKNDQIARKKLRLGNESMVDDIVLVNVLVEHVIQLYRQWKENGSKPGGPDKLWNPVQKKELVKSVLVKIVPKNDLEVICDKVIA